MSLIEAPCPLCKQRSAFTKEKLPAWFPFCSERCKLIDLGAWAAEKYRVPTKEAPSQDEGSGEKSSGKED